MGRSRRIKNTNILEIKIDDVPPPVADRIYTTRKIYFRGRATTIICHENEPSALVALCNALLLCGMRPGDEWTGQVCEAVLVGILQGLLEAGFPHLGSEPEYTLQEMSEALQKLGGEVNMDVNFSGTKCFGHQGKLYGGAVGLLFPLMGIILVHGWIIDPQDDELLNYVDGKSHDELQAMLNKVAGRSSKPKQKKWARVGKLLKENSLTSHGLSCLHDDIEEGQICVLYWQKHFHTVMQYNGHLYLLQTKKCYLGTEVVWKRLAGTMGEGELLTCYLTTTDLTAISVDGKDLSLVNFLMEPSALVADLQTSCIHSLYKSAGKQILADTDTTKSEWYLKTLWAEMNRDEFSTFYQSVCEIIKDETDSTKSREYLSTLMKIHNEVLAEVAKKGIQNHALEQVTYILQMNSHVAKMVGEKFDVQIRTIFKDMLLIYSDCIQRIARTNLEGKPDDHLRCVTKEVLNLLNTFLSEAQGSHNDLTMLIVDNPAFAYCSRDRREMEYLSLFETIVKGCEEKMHEKILIKLTEILNDFSMPAIEIYKYPEQCLKYLSLLDAITTQCFEVLTAESCERLEPVMNFIIGSLCQTENAIDEDAFHLLYRILEKMKTAKLKNYFYKTYFSKIAEEIIKILIGSHDHSELYLAVLQLLFKGLADLTEHISDAPLQATEFNAMVIRDHVMKFMKTTFPNIITSVAGIFVDGLLNSSNDLSNILNNVREAVVTSREQVDPAEASTKEVLRLWTNEASDLSLGTMSREQMASSKTASFDSMLPSKIDSRLVEWFQNDFLPTFTKMKESVAFYKRQVHSMCTNHSEVLHIKFSDLIDHDPEMAIEICNCYDRIWKKLENAGIAFIWSEANENEFPRPINLKVLIVDVPVANSVVLFTEFIRTPGNEIIEDRIIFRGPNSKKVQDTTPIGRIAYNSYSRQLTSAHACGMAYGTFGLKHFVVVNNKHFRICKQYGYVGCDYESKKQDCVQFSSTFIPLFGSAALFEVLADDLKSFIPASQFSLKMEKQFHLFVTSHLAGKHAMVRSSFWPKLQKVPACLSVKGRNQWNKMLMEGFKWREPVKADPILKRLYNYNPAERGKHDKTVPAQEFTLVDVAPEGAILAPEGAILAPEGATLAPEGAILTPEGATLAPEGPMLTPEEVLKLINQDYGDTVYNPSLQSLLDFLRNGTEHLHWGALKGKKLIQKLIEVDLLLSNFLPCMIEIMRALLFSPEMTDEIRDALEDVFYLYDLVEPEASDERRTLR